MPTTDGRDHLGRWRPRPYGFVARLNHATPEVAEAQRPTSIFGDEPPLPTSRATFAKFMLGPWTAVGASSR